METGYRLWAPEDIQIVSAGMRKSDVLELRDSCGQDPVTALKRSVELTQDCFTGIVENEPIAMFGCANHGDPLIGIPWMLCTDRFDEEVKYGKHKRKFLREGRGIVAGWNDQYPLLTNYVDCRNENAINWLQWLGFTFLREVEMPSAVPFYEFIRIKQTHV